MEELDAVLRKYVAEGQDTADKLLGAAFVVTDKDGLRYSGSSGRVHFDADSERFTTDSFTWVASMTKIITSTCLMQLVETGRVKLGDDLRELVPELGTMQILRGFEDDGKPRLEDNVRPITLKHLLTHTLGLGYDIADPNIMKWSKYVGRTATNLDWNKEGFNTPIKFAPGDGWYYGMAMDWAGFALETITGQPLGEYMQEHIFSPLGMADTGFWPERLLQTSDRTVTFAFRREDSLKPGPMIIPKEHEVESGGAGLFSTAADYARFFRGFLQGKLVTEKTMQLMFSPHLDDAQSAMLEMISYDMGISLGFAPEFPKGLKLNHGLGGVMNMEDVPGKRRKGSLMWSGMCNSRWWVDRETGIAAAVFVNVLPHGDPVLARLYNELELTVYKFLVAK